MVAQAPIPVVAQVPVPVVAQVPVPVVAQVPVPVVAQFVVPVVAQVPVPVVAQVPVPVVAQVVVPVVAQVPVPLVAQVPVPVVAQVPVPVVAQVVVPVVAQVLKRKISSADPISVKRPDNQRNEIRIDTRPELKVGARVKFMQTRKGFTTAPIWIFQSEAYGIVEEQKGRKWNVRWYLDTTSILMTHVDADVYTVR